MLIFAAMLVVAIGWIAWDVIRHMRAVTRWRDLRDDLDLP